MAASRGTQGSTVPGAETEIDNGQANHGPQQLSNVSNQLLYSDNYGECYQENKLTVVGKGSKTLVKGQLETVDVPPSSVLSRIRKFLPELSMANKEMALELVSNPGSADRFNIEHLGGDDREHVEMNVSVVAPELLAEDDSSTDESFSESESEFEENLKEEVKQTIKLHLASKCVKPGIEIIEDVQPTKQNITDR